MPNPLDKLVPDGPRLKRRAPKASKKAAQRKSTVAAKGATRNRPPRSVTPKAPSVWLHRVLILGAVAFVLTVGVQAYLHVHSLPVRHITIAGEMEHTQAEVVQELVQ